MRVVNTNGATLPWTASCRQQPCRNMMGQRWRIQFMTIGRVVWWYHTPTASGKARYIEREGKARGERERERREGTPAGGKIAERGFDPRTFGL